MAGPNQTGDKDKEVQDKLRNDESTQSLSRDNDTQNATLDATATPDQTITDTKKDDIPTLDQDIEPLPTPEGIAATQDAESSVMVGRDTNNIGDNATSNATLDAAELISSGPDAQDIVDDAHKNETQYGFGADAAAKQMNDALSGAGEGKTNTTFTAKTSDAEEQKRKEDSLANIRAIAMSADIVAAYAQLEADIQGMGDELNTMTNVFSELDEQASQILAELNQKATEKLSELNTLKQELTDIKNNTMLSPEDLDAQINLKQQEIRFAEEALEFYNESIVKTQNQIQETRDEIATTQQEVNDLNRKIIVAKATGDPENRLAGLKDEMIIAKNQLATSQESIKDLKNENIRAEATMELVSNLPGKSYSCGANASIEHQKAASIGAQADIVAAMRKATEDGDLNQSELDNLNKIMNDAGITQSDKSNFIDSYTGANGSITIDDPDNPGQSKTLTGDEATAHLQSQWEAIKEKIETASEDVQVKSYDLQAAQAAVAEAQGNVNALSLSVNTASAKLGTLLEGVETAEDSFAAIENASIKYDSVYDYMSENYHLDMGYVDDALGLIDESFTSGESIDEVAKDPDRILKDAKGDLVYIDPDTQGMYTVTTDAEGNQTMDDVSPLETMQLYQKMYEEKLLPRNFVKDEGGAHAEFSKDNTFLESIAKSMLPGFMKSDAQLEKATAFAATRQKITNEARADLAKAEAALDSGVESVGDLKSDVNAANLKLAQAQETLKLAEAEAVTFTASSEKNAAIANANLAQTSNSATIEVVASDAETNINEESTASETQWEGKETHDMAIPDHDLADAEASRNSALKEVELAALNGDSISQEDYNKLKDLPGMSGTQLNDMMEKNKVALEQSETSPDNNSVGANPSNTIVAQQFGVQFEVTPIQVPMAPPPNPNGISPAANYDSFADSIDFTKTNDPSSTTNSFDPVAVKQSENSPVATSGFANALLEKPDESETGAPKIDGLTPLQAEQLRMQEENQRQATLAALAAQNAGAGGGATG